MPISWIFIFFCYLGFIFCQLDPTEKQSLLDFYTATDGDNWINKSGWDNVSSDPCLDNWLGVTCNAADTNVIYFILLSNDLGGVLFDLNLPNLQILSLANNNIGGSIPDFTNLPNLTLLFLNDNNITGSIPDFTTLPNLVQLWVNDNNITGSIPDFINLTNLREIFLNDNNIAGNIPDFTNLPNLQELRVNDNNIGGSIPDFTNLPILTRLWVNDNNIGGSIPDFINLSNLRELRLYNNNIAGSIPDFSNLANLQKLYVYNNNIGGSIPDFTNLPNLREIFLNDNNIGGSIPDFINLPALTYLYLDRNNIGGSIPDFINLPALTYLYLDDNNIGGSIPDFTNITNLRQFRSNNNLHCGTLPIDNPTSFSISLGGIYNIFEPPERSWCTDCVYDAFEGICCNEGEFNNAGTCELCNETCSICVDETSCRACVDGYYDDGLGGFCLKCDDNCKTCSGSSTNCLSCESPEPYLNGTVCEVCPDGEYDNGLDTCVVCDNNCGTCSGSSTTCLSCKSPEPYLNGTVCEVCPDGEYDNGSDTCANCDNNCGTCSGSSTNCLSCKSPEPYLNGTVCEACPDGEYDNGLDTCVVCDNNCKTCSGSSTNCLSCESPLPYLNGTICEACPDGEYDNGFDSCIACDVNCGTNNEEICEFIAPVIDTIPPVISCPNDYSVFANDICQGFQIPSNSAVATDNCNLNTISYNPDFVLPLDIGQHNISATASDIEGNSATCYYIITVIDNTQPFIICPQDILLPADENCENIMPFQPPISISDNCPNVSYTQSPVGGNIISEGIHNVELIANDSSGNMNICSYNVQVEDMEPPIFLNCPIDNISFNNEPGMCYKNVDISIETQNVLDNCGIKDIIVNYPYNGYNFPVGISHINSTVIDTNNLETQCLYSISIIDDEPPTIICPNNILLETENSTQVIFYEEPIISDNCPENLQITNTANPGDSFPIGTTIITYSAFDGIYNVTCNFNITIIQILSTPSSTPPPSLILVHPEQLSPIISSKTPTNSKKNSYSPSSSITPVPDIMECNGDCDFGEQEIILSNEDEVQGNVNLTTNSGTEVGYLIIPEDLTLDSTILTVLISSTNEPNISPIDGTLLGSSIIDITITDYFGNNIRLLNDDLRICLKDNSATDDSCLGFFNTEKQEWECEDECLDKVEDGTYCGTTDHLTSFALLLNGNTNDNNPCDSSSNNYIIAWLSVAFIILSIIIIILAVILNESIYFYKKKKKQRAFKELDKRLIAINNKQYL